MKARHLLCFLALCAVQPGCAFMFYATRNLIEAPIAHYDHAKERYRLRCDAADAWKQVEAESPIVHSKHYAKGFKAGYVDFIWAGGLGEPPSLPPWPYRGTHFQTPEGDLAIQDWFAGFRHGAEVARASGKRDGTVVPVSQPPRFDPFTVPPRAPEASLPRPQLLPGPEIAPSPRIVPPPEPIGKR